MNGGWEWMVDGEEAPALRLGDLAGMQALGDGLVAKLGLAVVGQPQWHQFPDPGGVTGMYLLAESHLTIHTFPESGVITLNLYSCRERTSSDRGAVAEALRVMVQEAAAARMVRVVEHRRGSAALERQEPMAR